MQSSFVKKTGAFLKIAGILLIIGFIIHPAGEGPDYILTNEWVPAHFLLWVGFSFSILGWMGVFEIISSKVKGLANLGFVLIEIGTAFLVGIFLEAFLIDPIIAANSPSLFEAIGSSSAFTVFFAIIGVFIAGAVVFGYAIMKSKMLGKWGGELLIIGSLMLLITLLTGQPEKIIDLSGIVFGIGQVLLGYRIWMKRR